MLSTCSHQCRWLVQQRACHVLSCLCDNACKKTLAICRKRRASCPVSKACPYMACMCWTETLIWYKQKKQPPAIVRLTLNFWYFTWPRPSISVQMKKMFVLKSCKWQFQCLPRSFTKAYINLHGWIYMTIKWITKRGQKYINHSSSNAIYFIQGRQTLCRLITNLFLWSKHFSSLTLLCKTWIIYSHVYTVGAHLYRMCICAPINTSSTFYALKHNKCGLHESNKSNKK